MAPKKKKGGGKKKGKKSKGGKKGKGGKRGKRGNKLLGDTVPAEEMTRDNLLDQVNQMREEVEREREERNYFQLERDKINTFWEITKRQLDQARAEGRLKDRTMEEAEERHQIEIRVYKQKVKHLLYEQQNNLSQLKTDNAVILKMAQDNHSQSELELRKDKRALKAELKERELAHAELIKNLKKKNDEEFSDAMTSYKTQLEEIESKYEEKLRILREDLELRRKTEIHEIEERKNGQINTLIKNHDKAFSDVKTYYNDITLNNIALVSSLKEQLEVLKAREDRHLKDIKELEEKNRELVEPLEIIQKKITFYKIKLANYDKDKELLKVTRARLKVLTDEVKVVKWEKEIVEQTLQRVQEERDELARKFLEAVNDVEQKCGLKNLLLEKKLGAMVISLEKKEAQLNEVLAMSNLDPAALKVVTKKLEDVLDSKNYAIKDLQYELARISKAHDEILRACQSKLKQFGIAVDDLGFQPLKDTVKGQKLGKAPAGLVSAPS